MPRRVVDLFVCLLVTLAVTTARAQTPGTIAGSVRDTAGAILPGVTVSATNESTGLVRSAVTDSKE